MSLSRVLYKRKHTASPLFNPWPVLLRLFVLRFIHLVGYITTHFNSAAFHCVDVPVCPCSTHELPVLSIFKEDPKMTQAQISERPQGHPRGELRHRSGGRQDEPGGGKVRSRALGGMGGVSAAGGLLEGPRLGCEARAPLCAQPGHSPPQDLFEGSCCQCPHLQMSKLRHGWV